MLAQWFVRSPHMIVRSWVRMPPSERWKNNFKSRKVVEQIFGKNNSDFFKMAINPQPLSRLFSSFQTIITIFTTNICKKCPSSIRWWGLNPRSSEHKYPPITTRLTIQIFPSNLIHNSPPPILEPERCSRPLQLQQQQQGRSNTKSLPLRKDQRGRARRGWGELMS